MVCASHIDLLVNALTALKTAVAIVALLDHPSKPLSTVILEQYRPPIGNTCIGTSFPPTRDNILLANPTRPLSELPAGLVDGGESPEYAPLSFSRRECKADVREIRDAALRELIEETGYGGDGEGAGKATVEEVSPLLVRITGVTCYQSTKHAAVPIGVGSWVRDPSKTKVTCRLTSK
jgi:ADP-ribose pyrophosphatase